MNIVTKWVLVQEKSENKNKLGDQLQCLLKELEVVTHQTLK